MMEVPPVNGIGMYGDYPSVPADVLSHGESIIVPRPMPPRLSDGETLYAMLSGVNGRRAAVAEIRRLQGLGQYARIAAYHNLIVAQRAINDYADCGGVPGVAMQVRLIGVREGLVVLEGVREEYELLLIGAQSL